MKTKYQGKQKTRDASKFRKQIIVSSKPHSVASESQAKVRRGRLDREYR